MKNEKVKNQKVKCKMTYKNLKRNFHQFILIVGMILTITFGCQEPVDKSGQRPVTGKQVTLKDVPYRPLSQLMPPQGYWDKPKYPELIKLTPVLSVRQELSQAPRERWGQVVHRVRRGDTLLSIARSYYGNENWKVIFDNNRDVLDSPGQLQEGKLIYLPMSPLRGASGNMKPPHRRPDYYVVNEGDTLTGIAKLFLGDSGRYRQIAELNNLPNPNQLQHGIMLVLPQGNH